MTITPIPAGQINWNIQNEANVADLQTQVTTVSNLANNLSATAPSFGLIGWTEDPITVNTGQLLVNGTLYLARINVGATATATRLFWGINTAGVTPTAGQNFVSLWDSTGARLANVNVDARVTGTGLFQESISVALTPGFYWVGFLFNAGTAPSVYRANSLNGTLTNTGLATNALRYATNGTGLTASPASIAPASNSVSMFSLFATLAP